MFGVERFHQYWLGRKFVAFTDHKLLLLLMGPDQAVPKQASRRVVRWALRLDVTLGKEPVSQATSRYPGLSQVVKAVSRREEIAERTYSHNAAELCQQQGSLLWGSRVVIVQSLRCRSFQICQENQRVSRHVESTSWPFLERPWCRQHVHFGGPFKGHYFLFVVDAFYKWVEILPVTTSLKSRVVFIFRAGALDRGSGQAVCIRMMFP
ncbi:uncharacterized protein LOC144166210 [Haemaphysalis longicornis]